MAGETFTARPVPGVAPDGLFAGNLAGPGGVRDLNDWEKR
jgi:hypothetical protein